VEQSWKTIAQMLFKKKKEKKKKKKNNISTITFKLSSMYNLVLVEP